MLGLKGHKGQIHDGPISRSLYNDLFNTYIKFMLLSQSARLLLTFLPCRPTTTPIYSEMMYNYRITYWNLFCTHCLLQEEVAIV